MFSLTLTRVNYLQNSGNVLAVSRGLTSDVLRMPSSWGEKQMLASYSWEAVLD